PTLAGRPGSGGPKFEMGPLISRRRGAAGHAPSSPQARPNSEGVGSRGLKGGEPGPAPAPGIGRAEPSGGPDRSEVSLRGPGHRSTRSVGGSWRSRPARRVFGSRVDGSRRDGAPPGPAVYGSPPGPISPTSGTAPDRGTGRAVRVSSGDPPPPASPAPDRGVPGRTHSPTSSGSAARSSGPASSPRPEGRAESASGSRSPSRPSAGRPGASRTNPTRARTSRRESAHPRTPATETASDRRAAHAALRSSANAGAASLIVPRRGSGPAPPSPDTAAPGPR